MNRGKIISISGPTVRTDITTLQLYERVLVGHNLLTGEVVKLEKNSAVIQVYEDTRGLAAHEPIQPLGAPLQVTLGPGLLSRMFDGLQRPLEMHEDSSPFLTHGLKAVLPDQQYQFTPHKKAAAPVVAGDILGFVQEGSFEHPVLAPTGCSGIIQDIISGTFSIKDPVAVLEDSTEIYATHLWPVRIPRPYKKKCIPEKPIITGQRVIDFLFPMAQGSTAIIPGGFGSGKTILEQSIAKFADVDIVIYAGCGERGNEMAELIDEFRNMTDGRKQKPLMDRTVMVVNTSNMPVAAREASIYTAVTMGEYFRDMGLDVLLLADSISRWAEALREISSSLEEMPGEEGYPTYLPSRLASFVERAGVVETCAGKQGSLSMVLSVSPPGEDFTEPVTQALLRTTGTFLMLDSKLAHSRHFPAINWSQSYSLYEKSLSRYYQDNFSSLWENMRCYCRELLREEEKLQEVVEIIGLDGLQDRDRLIMAVAEEIRRHFLQQNAYDDDACSSPEQTLNLIQTIINRHNLTEVEFKTESREN
jgi:V/A-type H+-transporting ATPase subunit A